MKNGGEDGSICADAVSVFSEDGAESSRTTSGSSWVIGRKKVEEKRRSAVPLSKKAWTKDMKAASATGMDKEFLKAVNSLKKAIDNPKPERVAKYDEEDEDRYFCLILVGQLKSLEPRLKSMAKLNIMRVLNDLEWSMASFPTAQQPTMAQQPILPNSYGFTQENQQNSSLEYYPQMPTRIQNQQPIVTGLVTDAAGKRFH